ncbi:MAG: hypothetical protein AB7P07_11260 [Hyphomonadaceae bacterium]
MLDLLVVAILQAAAGPPSEQAEAPAAMAVAPPVEEEADSVRERRERHALRCRDRQVMGSRIQQRVCMSRAEEEQQQRDSQDIAHRMHRSGPWDGTLPTGP